MILERVECNRTYGFLDNDSTGLDVKQLKWGLLKNIRDEPLHPAGPRWHPVASRQEGQPWLRKVWGVNAKLDGLNICPRVTWRRTAANPWVSGTRVGALVRERISPQTIIELVVEHIFLCSIREKTLDYDEGWFIVADES
jgi:hypothetical protein